jgi:hypothetical protein
LCGANKQGSAAFLKKKKQKTSVNPGLGGWTGTGAAFQKAPLP